MFGEEGGLVDKKNPWGTLFDVEDPRSKFPQRKGKFLDVNQALELARFDLQYCDWRARQDLLTIMLLHEKVSDLSIGKYIKLLYSIYKCNQIYGIDCWS